MRCHKRKYILNLGKIKKKKAGGGNIMMDGFSGDLNTMLLLCFGQSDGCCGCPGERAPAAGLGAGSACRGTPALSALGGASVVSGDAAQLLAGIAAEVCSNVFPLCTAAWYEARCALQLGEVQRASDSKTPSEFISEGVHGAAEPLQLFTGFHQGSGCLDHPGYWRTRYFYSSKAYGLLIRGALLGLRPRMAFGWDRLKGRSGGKSTLGIFFFHWCKYYCLWLTCWCQN